jgi:SAM-dependent methyltransferase
MLISSAPDRRGCPVCGAGGLTPVVDVTAVPVFCNVLWATRDEALTAPRGDISLRFCERCGTIHNAAFDPELVRYSPDYENSLHASPAFREFARGLARRLVERYDLRGKDLVDIGCGKGEFLTLLCEGTGNRGFGFDPSYGGQAAGADGVTIVREHYSDAHTSTPADLITCRHVLEHLDDPRALLRTLRGSSATLYFEVPDGDYMLRETACWDVIYEHASYFTATGLRHLFEDFGFTTLDVGSSFGGQYLYLEAAARESASPSAPSGAELKPLAARFGRRYAEKVESWTERLRELDSEGRRVTLWGAGSKGVTFLNVVPGADRIERVIDLNQRKQGRFVPGTGHEILAPDAVRERPPDAVLAMNPLYVEEIGRALGDLGVDADVIAV